MSRYSSTEVFTRVGVGKALGQDVPLHDPEHLPPFLGAHHSLKLPRHQHVALLLEARLHHVE